MPIITKDELVERIVRRSPTVAPLPRKVIRAVLNGFIAELEGGIRIKSSRASVIECQSSKPTGASEPRKARGRSRAVPPVPKVPRIIQDQVDRLIDKAKREGLTRREQVALHQILDYLDDLTIRALEGLVAKTRNGNGKT